VSPTDPPLPPSSDEPSDEPQWDGGGPGEPPAPLPPEEEPAPTGVPGEPLEPSAAEPGEEPPAEQPTEVVPQVDLTEPLPETGLGPTEVIAPTGLEPTGLEPTEVIAGGVAVAEGTGETTREHRRRVSHRRYVIRRIGVAVVTLAIIGGAVWLLVALLGDDDNSADSADSTTPATSEAAAIPPTTRASTTTEATATTAAAVVEGTEALEATEPATTPPQEEPELTEPTDSVPASTAETGDTVTESSPPGTVVYDLSSEPTCTIGQTLRQGSAGPQVQCLQERLNEVTTGGTTLPEDGFYGEQTEAAVRAFQEANELAADGIVGPTTGGALGIWPE
jgi:eukaryotic-like serine/threonine-protein kinase